MIHWLNMMRGKGIGALGTSCQGIGDILSGHWGHPLRGLGTSCQGIGDILSGHWRHPVRGCYGKRTNCYWRMDSVMINDDNDYDNKWWFHYLLCYSVCYILTIQHDILQAALQYISWPASMQPHSISPSLPASSHTVYLPACQQAALQYISWLASKQPYRISPGLLASSLLVL